MTAKIYELDNQRPHEACIVQCHECWKRVVSIHREGVTGPFECSACGAMACVPTGEEMEY